MLWLQLVMVSGAFVRGGEELMVKKAHGTCTKPVQPQLRFGVDRNLADNICCFNRHGAEPRGSATKVLRYWLTASADEPMTFYDSVWGKPCFTAPVGRSTQDFLRESDDHGWPSFRDAEVNDEHVRCLADGEVVTTDGVHLGHLIPDQHGKNRFCINLVSIAGQPPARRWSASDFRQALRRGA